jgi:hypothetical protein
VKRLHFFGIPNLQKPVALPPGVLYNTVSIDEDFPMADQSPLRPPDRPRLADAREDLERTTLSGLPDLFSQLAYLASLRDMATNAYEHWGLDRTYGHALTQEALLLTHQDVFRRLCALSLEELAGQITRFLSDRPDGGRTLLSNWQRDFSYNLLAPAGIDDLELENFRINFEAVMAAAALRLKV